jgi:imidazolonepropionase-like amidohydrolase
MLNGRGLLDIEANQTWEDIAIGGVAMAELYLMEGFTTVRDMGGANAGLQRAINAGTIVGPRIYPSGAFIGGRGGHADFALYSSLQGEPTQMSRLNMARETNGADEVLAAARNNFRQGTSQIKIMQTGGVASLFDPWQLNGMTVAEIEAAVQVANDYQSYVGAHSYTADAMLRALDLGVKTIEHGFMFNDEVHAKMVEKGAYITTNLTAFSPLLAEIEALGDPRNRHVAGRWQSPGGPLSHRSGGQVVRRAASGRGADDPHYHEGRCDLQEHFGGVNSALYAGTI